MASGWTAELQPFDAAEIFRVLDDHGVRYILVGGVAAVAHGYTGATFDADIVPERGDDNLGRLAAALVALEAKVYADPRRSSGSPPEAGDLDLNDPASLRRRLAWYFSTSAGRLDVLLVVDGPGGFEPLAEHASVVRMAGVDVLVMSLEDLIEAKEAARRPKDLRALGELRELLAEQRRLR